MIKKTSLIKRTVKTPSGNGKVEDIYITELGYVMIKVKLKESSGVKFVNYNIGVLEKLAQSDQIEFL
jgi:hypothetical protein